MASRLDTTDLDLSRAFGDRPLHRDALRCLRYMHDIENHTVCYLRDLLATDAHTDPAITTFLTMWNFEEHWHGEALGRVLKAHGELAGRARVSAIRGTRGPLDRLRPIAFTVGSLIVPDLTAVAVAWGAINEWTTQAGYARLAARADHPTLTDLLKRIMRQEGRHIDFYTAEARARLSRSKFTRQLTRMALRRWWHPVGTGVVDPAETAFVVDYLFGGPEGQQAARRIDRNIDRLPGLAGLALVGNARERAA